MQADPRDGWVELVTAGDWTRVRGRGGVLIVTDRYTDSAEGGPKFHHPGCPFADRKFFKEKVLDRLERGLRPNGSWYWVADQHADG